MRQAHEGDAGRTGDGPWRWSLAWQHTWYPSCGKHTGDVWAAGANGLDCGCGSAMLEDLCPVSDGATTRAATHICSPGQPYDSQFREALVETLQRRQESLFVRDVSMAGEVCHLAVEVEDQVVLQGAISQGRPRETTAPTCSFGPSPWLRRRGRRRPGR